MKGFILAILTAAAWSMPSGATGRERKADDGTPHTYVQRFDARGERYSSERDAAADMELVSQRIRAAGYVILHSFVAADADRNSPFNYYRFEISYIAPHHAQVDPAHLETLRQLKADPDDCQVLNPEFCR